VKVVVSVDQGKRYVQIEQERLCQLAEQLDKHLKEKKTQHEIAQKQALSRKRRESLANSTSMSSSSQIVSSLSDRLVLLKPLQRDLRDDWAAFADLHEASSSTSLLTSLEEVRSSSFKNTGKKHFLLMSLMVLAQRRTESSRPGVTACHTRLCFRQRPDSLIPFWL